MNLRLGCGGTPARGSSERAPEGVVNSRQGWGGELPLEELQADNDHLRGGDC